MPVYDPSAGRDYGDDPRPRPVARPASPRPLAYLLLLAFGVGVGVVGFWLGGTVLNRLRNPPAVTNPDAKPKEAVANGPLDADENEANVVFEAVKPSVVNVDTVTVARDRFDERLTEQTGTGSGFVWDADGRIVTNFHVVQDTLRRPNMAIRVVLADRSQYPATLVGTAPDYDLAVIQIAAPADRLKPLAVATSGDLKVGQRAYAIGNPFGLSLTLTAGIIGSLDRSIDAPTGASIPGAVQHSAAINPGNSGGPLLNRAGHLIGVNTSIPETRGGGNVGIGFSIPSDTVNRVVTEIVRTGSTQKPDLGVRLYDQKKLRRAGYEKGVMVAEVVAGGPAEQAKLRGIRRNTETGRAEPGDVIVAINGEEVAGVDDLQRALAKLKPGDAARVKYMRSETEREATITVRGA